MKTKQSEPEETPDKNKTSLIYGQGKGKRKRVRKSEERRKQKIKSPKQTTCTKHLSTTEANIKWQKGRQIRNHRK